MFLTNQNCVRVGNKTGWIVFYICCKTPKYWNKQGFDFAWHLYGCETWSLTRTEEHRL